MSQRVECYGVIGHRKCVFVFIKEMDAHSRKTHYTVSQLFPKDYGLLYFVCLDIHSIYIIYIVPLQ